MLACQKEVANWGGIYAKSTLKEVRGNLGAKKVKGEVGGSLCQNGVPGKSMPKEVREEVRENICQQRFGEIYAKSTIKEVGEIYATKGSRERSGKIYAKKGRGESMPKKVWGNLCQIY